MKISLRLKTIISFLVFTGIFFLPFNSYEGISFLGEFSRDSCTLFFLAAAFLLLLNSLLTGKISLPIKNPVFQGVCLFFIWLIIATLLNSNNISSYYFKNTTGFNRFIRQFIALILSGLVFLIMYYNVFKYYSVKTVFFKTRRVIFYSFVVVSIYTTLEILLIKFNVLALEDFFRLFNYFPFTETELDFRNARISSVTFEPPALGTYLFTIAGWMFSYIITEKNTLRKYAPAVLVILFALFSGSRAALFIIFIQAFAFSFFLLKKKKHQLLFARILKYSFVVAVILFLIKGKEISNYIVEKATSFGIEDDTHGISNKSRFGIQYTLGLIFLENPISGVGLGQQAFASIPLYPDWATDNNWEFRLKYLNNDIPSFPPGYNIYLRILAESGIIGLLLFLAILTAILYSCYKLTNSGTGSYSLLALVIFVSMIGVVFNWLKMDTYRAFSFWIHLALFFIITENKLKLQFSKNEK